MPLEQIHDFAKYIYIYQKHLNVKHIIPINDYTKQFKRSTTNVRRWNKNGSLYLQVKADETFLLSVALHLLIIILSVKSGQKWSVK